MRTEVDRLTTALEASEAAREDALQVIADLRVDVALGRAQIRNLQAANAALASEVNERDATIATGVAIGPKVG